MSEAVLVDTEIVHSPGIYFRMGGGASQLDRTEPAVGGGHGIHNRRGAPPADMEMCVSDEMEELEPDAVSLEDASSSDGESERLACWYCRIRGRRTCICPLVGSCCCPPDGAQLPSCVFYSPRMQGLLVGERTEFETAITHWTEVDRGIEAEDERVAQENRKYFDEVLVKHGEWGAFFSKCEDLEVGAKIGEGGQAEIFEAASKTLLEDMYNWGLVAKVWKKGVSLKDLERQWPPQMLTKAVQGEDGGWPFRNIMGGAFIRDGEMKNRFAFVMERWEGDLRTSIDNHILKLLCENNHGPPYSTFGVLLLLIWEASNDLNKMHEAGVLHRDIKASNLLLDDMYTETSNSPLIIDFECSVGVIGTGFWRAPEVLKQLQERVPTHKVVLTEKADIYSFGMMCYELITGRIPFEGHPGNDYSVVLRGGRPELPHDLNKELNQLILDCWQHDLELRPTASGIIYRVLRLGQDLRLFPFGDD